MNKSYLHVLELKNHSQFKTFFYVCFNSEASTGVTEFPLVLEVWGPWDLHFQETEGPFSFLRVPTLLKFFCVCACVCACMRARVSVVITWGQSRKTR